MISALAEHEEQLELVYIDKRDKLAMKKFIRESKITRKRKIDDTEIFSHIAYLCKHLTRAFKKSKTGFLSISDMEYKQFFRDE